jgi:hypothetical protein
MRQAAYRSHWRIFSSQFPQNRAPPFVASAIRAQMSLSPNSSSIIAVCACRVSSGQRAIRISAQIARSFAPICLTANSMRAIVPCAVRSRQSGARQRRATMYWAAAACARLSPKHKSRRPRNRPRNRPRKQHPDRWRKHTPSFGTFQAVDDYRNQGSVRPLFQWPSSVRAKNASYVLAVLLC